NEGVCSWYDFTLKIHELSGITTCKVSPIESKDYPAKAPRPSFSVLNKAKIKKTFGIEIPHWEQSLKQCLFKLA
ncbi:MAG: sugar nucleotide-binding protein, partial [Paludibacteraceae bacterium]|nr:sugar nucleotide-binding protein [Paludibacteraceae bacterium]